MAAMVPIQVETGHVPETARPVADAVLTAPAVHTDAHIPVLADGVAATRLAGVVEEVHTVVATAVGLVGLLLPPVRPVLLRRLARPAGRLLDGRPRPFTGTLAILPARPTTATRPATVPPPAP